MELPKSISKWISTKADADSEAVKTNLTLDLSGLTWADILEYAVMALVVKWQGLARKKAIPTTATYIVPKPGTRSTVDPREATIAFFMGKGATREQAEKIADMPDLTKIIAEA